MKLIGISQSSPITSQYRKPTPFYAHVYTYVHVAIMHIVHHHTNPNYMYMYMYMYMYVRALFLGLQSLVRLVLLLALYITCMHMQYAPSLVFFLVVVGVCQGSLLGEVTVS